MPLHPLPTMATLFLACMAVERNNGTAYRNEERNEKPNFKDFWSVEQYKQGQLALEVILKRCPSTCTLPHPGADHFGYSMTIDRVPESGAQPRRWYARDYPTVPSLTLSLSKRLTLDVSSPTSPISFLPTYCCTRLCARPPSQYAAVPTYHPAKCQCESRLRD